MINNWPYVLIFEDDAWPNINAKNNIPNIFNNINFLKKYKFSCDSLILGWNKKYFKKSIKIKNIHNNITNLAGGHAYIVFQHAYEKIINNVFNHTSDFLCADYIITNKNNILSWIACNNQFIQFIHKDFKTLNIQGISHTNECLIKNNMFYIQNHKYKNTPFKNFVDFNDLKI